MCVGVSRCGCWLVVLSYNPCQLLSILLACCLPDEVDADVNASLWVVVVVVL